MTMLINGKWSTEEWHPHQTANVEGEFIRKPSTFRNWVTPDGAAGPTGTGGFNAEAGRYHLYASLNCPWASRTLMARKLKGLEDVVSLSIVEPMVTDQGWRFGDFPGAIPDAVNGAGYLHQIYTRSDPKFTGRVTVPVLWDKTRIVIVNNESAEIVRMFNSAFDGITGNRVDLYPEGLRSQIEALNHAIYDSFNNGVYRAGFALAQSAYEEAVTSVFTTLDMLETRLADGRKFLFGDDLTETDLRAFVTLFRFDVAYYSLFKCNIRRIADYPHLSTYLRSVLDTPGIRETANLEHIKRGYYSIRAVNPSGICPVGPALDFQAGAGSIAGRRMSFQ